MSASLYPWIVIGHLVGIVVWVGSLLAVLSLLSAHNRADATNRPALVTSARSMALLMDLGATLAIAFGFYLAFSSPMYPNTAFKSGGWLHVKLLLVVVGILVPHGIMRAKLAKFRRNESSNVPGFLLPLILIAAIGAITLGKHPTLLRKAPSIPSMTSSVG